MSLDASRAVQEWIDAKHSAGEIDKTKTLDDDTCDAIGIPRGSTVEDMLHAKTDKLFQAIVDELTANGAVSVTVPSGITVEDGGGNTVGSTVDSPTANGGIQ